MEEIPREQVQSVTNSNMKARSAAVRPVTPRPTLRLSRPGTPSPAMRSFTPRTSPRTSPNLAAIRSLPLAPRGMAGGGRGLGPAVRPGTPRPPLRLGRPPGTPSVRMPPPPAGAVRPIQPSTASTSIMSRLQRITGLTVQTVSQSASSVETALTQLESLQSTIMTAAVQVSVDACCKTLLRSSTPKKLSLPPIKGICPHQSFDILFASKVLFPCCISGAWLVHNSYICSRGKICRRTSLKPGRRSRMLSKLPRCTYLTLNLSCNWKFVFLCMNGDNFFKSSQNPFRVSDKIISNNERFC